MTIKSRQGRGALGVSLMLALTLIYSIFPQEKGWVILPWSAAVAMTLPGAEQINREMIAAPPVVAVVAAQRGAVTTEEQKAPQELDLEALEQRLRETRAIGFFTKLALRNQIDDLLNRFRTYHRGRPGIDLEELHEDYNLLLLKVQSLLQDDDPELARDIAASHKALWELLTDPEQFAEL